MLSSNEFSALVPSRSSAACACSLDWQSPTLGTTPPHMHRETSMPALPLNGALAAKVIRKRIKERISSLTRPPAASSDGGEAGITARPPGLGIVMANGYV